MSNVTALRITDNTAPAEAPAQVADSPYLSPAQVAEYVPGVSTRQLQRWREEGRGPRYAKAGKTVVYRRTDIDAWVAGNLIGTREQS